MTGAAWDPGGLWVVAPALGAYLLHAPVLRWDLLRPLARPLDGGATFRGRRVLGDNKTWRGALVMAAGVVLAALLLSRLPAFAACWPAPLRAHPLGYALLLALGFVAGELPNSFLKRQLGVAPGAQRRSPVGMALALYDQVDFVPGIWLALGPLWWMPAAQVLTLLAVAAALHLCVNGVGYAIGARKGWL